MPSRDGPPQGSPKRQFRKRRRGQQAGAPRSQQPLITSGAGEPGDTKDTEDTGRLPAEALPPAHLLPAHPDSENSSDFQATPSSMELAAGCLRPGFRLSSELLPL